MEKAWQKYQEDQVWAPHHQRMRIYDNCRWTMENIEEHGLVLQQHFPYKFSKFSENI